MKKEEFRTLFHLKKGPPGRRRGCPRRLPQIRTCPIKASGSSRYGLTCALLPAGVSCTAPGAQSPRPVAPRQFRSEASPSLGRVPAHRFPRPQRYYGTLRLLLPIPPALMTSGGTTARQVHSLRPAADARRASRGDCGSAPPAGPIEGSVETDRSPRFLGNPGDGPLGSWTPARSDAPGHFGTPTRPPLVSRTWALATKSFRGSMSEHVRLAADASQPGSPLGHARLASDCWPGSIGRDWLPAGLLQKVSECTRYISSPFPKLSWRNDTIFLIRELRGELPNP